MINYLVDTHVFIWALQNNPKLSSAHRKVIESEQNVYVSIAILWELKIKQSLNKIKLPASIFTHFEKLGYSLLEIKIEHLIALGSLKNFHRDPFDRILIAQAKYENIALLTSDKILKKYQIKTL